MPFPAKEYYRLRSLQKRWGVSQEDLFYWLENGLLRACIWLPLRYVERGVIRNRKFIYETHEHQEGFVSVRAEDCRRICGTGRTKLRIFNSVRDDSHMVRLAYEPPQPDICASVLDLVVLKQDRDKFEKAYDITEGKGCDLHPEKMAPPVVTSEDYRYVKLDEKEFHLGDVQARIIKQLHDASQSHKPWVHGKTLIYESGSNAIRLRDLFKNKKGWRDLIVSNERGYYRLNVPLEQLNQPPANKTVECNQSAY
jgi:hypothetical protein